MAEEAAPVVAEEEMELITEEDESKVDAGGSDTNGVGNGKRGREDDEEGGGEEEEEGASKKLKVDEKSVEEERLDKDSARVKLGAKEFGSSAEMFDYFFRLIHAWPTNLDVNKYEYMMLLELIKKGHAEAERKIGPGIKAFQVRFHPVFQSRCFFLVREDESVDDFSFRKCVDHIIPLPEDMKVKPGPNRALGGRKGRGGGGGHRGGRGRGGKGRS